MRTGTLGRAFESTAASYKFFWFLALLRLLPRYEVIPVRSAVAEMMVLAWAPGVLFRLSFGSHDRLQDVVRELQAAARLRPTATEARVRTALTRWPEAAARIEALSQLVPSRFLGPWLELGLHPSIRDDRRTRAIVRMAGETIQEAEGPPYALERGDDGFNILFGPGWREWLLNHQSILEGHAQFALARFLQARNPHVPGIPDKVRMPGGRKLAPARRIFERMRADSGSLLDAYTGSPLDSIFAIDHVLPRAFVAHDLLWNLVPTTIALNQAKAESLPAEAILEDVARYHFAIVSHAPVGAPELEDYVAVFGISEGELRALPEAAFVERYQRMLVPLLQVAASQGFRSGWRPAESRTLPLRSKRMAQRGA